MAAVGARFSCPGALTTIVADVLSIPPLPSLTVSVAVNVPAVANGCVGLTDADVISLRRRVYEVIEGPLMED